MTQPRSGRADSSTTTTTTATTTTISTSARGGSAASTAVAQGAGEQAVRLIDVDALSPEEAAHALIDHAVRINASDLFLLSNEQHLAVHVRHLGIVRPIAIVRPEQGRRILSHVKTSAGMDITEKRHPADGRWIYISGEDAAVDLRINIVPTLYGEDFAIRLFIRGAGLFELDHLGMEKTQLQHYQQMIGNPGGLILSSGPTGSGKSATLYTTLRHLNDGRRKINTIEDPIEYAIDGVRQSQVNPVINLGFAELLRGVLRQSPDIIMIGEIRDQETARTAVHAANSGILVLATVHAPSAPAAVQSLRSLGAPSHFLAASLRGVVAQRLVRTLCPACRTSFDLSDAPETFEEVRPWLAPGEGKALFAAGGCEQCDQTGYAGRTGVFEVMHVTRDIRDLIAAGEPTRALRDKAVEEGMLQFRHAALLKVARGVTSTEEVFRVIPAEHMLDGE